MMPHNINNVNEFNIKSWHSSVAAYVEKYKNGIDIDISQLEKLLELCENKMCAEYYWAHGAYAGIREEMLFNNPNLSIPLRPDLFPKWDENQF